MFNPCPTYGNKNSKIANHFSCSFLSKFARECRSCNTIWVPGIRIWEAVAAVLFGLFLFGVGMIRLLQGIGSGRFDDIKVTVIAFAFGVFMVFLYVPAFENSRRRQTFIIKNCSDGPNAFSKQDKEK